ncbi:hypothetical protein [Austwickia sp. TVS 96-490-7B]|nr:hypothetical protein [Austwickia sp. TVS 96-490-7B]
MATPGLKSAAGTPRDTPYGGGCVEARGDMPPWGGDTVGIGTTDTIVG